MYIYISCLKLVPWSSAGNTLYRAFSIFSQIPDWIWGPFSLLFNGYRSSFPGVMRLGSEVVYSPPSTAVAENRWSYIVCLHAVDRDKFTCTVFTRSKDLNFKFYPKQSSGSIVIFIIVIPCGQTDGRTSTNDELLGGFCICANVLNPLNAELNPICYLLALLAHHSLHVSRIRVKSLTLRLLMSYLYIYIYIYIYGAPILDVSRSHTTTHHSR